MFIVERDNFSLSCLHPGLRFPSTSCLAFASVAVIYSCALVYVLSGPLEIATLFVN